MNQFSNFLDLKRVPCPLNVVKCKLALEKFSIEDNLVIEIDKGEPQIMVQNTLKDMGYKFKMICEEQNWIRLFIYYA